jgi:hypothetical protein
MTTPATNDLFATIRVGAKVTLLNRFDQKVTGRAVMRGPHGWVLNMGGAHGTPKVIDERAVILTVRGGAR